MKTIKIILTDAAAGTWITDGETVATGIRISEDRDYWQLVEEIQPSIEVWLAHKHSNEFRADGMLVLIDPNGTDFSGQPIEGGEVVCQFRILNGSIEAQV